MDLNAAATGLDITIRIGSYEDMAGTDIVVMAAGAPTPAAKSRLEMLPLNLAIVKENAEKINRFCPNAIVITETNLADSLNYMSYLLSQSRDRRKYIGYSPSDSIRFRQNFASALDTKASRIQGKVMGEHGDSQFCSSVP